MADERNLVDEEDTVKENSAQNRREKKKREKKEKKEKKNAKGNAPEPEEDEDEKGGGRLILVLTTILIIAIWMGIIGILIKTDVGGFGSTVLYPLLKDVPYVNKILPQPEETVEQTEDTEYQYGSLSEAISRIKELEKELDEASSTNKNDKKKIKDLKAQTRIFQNTKRMRLPLKRRRKNTTRRLFFPIRHPIYNSIRHIMRALIQKMPKSYTNKWLNRLPTIVRLKITQRHIPHEASGGGQHL